ncbi:partial Purine efflux pump PbuE, partial [uncultured bacterium]
VFYTGFVVGTLFCGLAPTYETLLAARIFTGLFGGVIASISLSIVADLFPYQVRGRVMGIIMAAFSVSQVLGLPLGMWLASHWNWYIPFMMIVAVAAPVGVMIALRLQPISGHLATSRDRQAFRRMAKILLKKHHIEAFAATALLATGGFMLMPFASTFSEHNLGLTRDQISLVYLVTGIASVFAGIIAGYLSDRIGKYAMFVVGSIIAIVVVLLYTNMGLSPMWMVMVVSAVLFVGISARMVSAQALTSAVPEPQDRGSFMALNSSVQQYSGAIASIIAGLIVAQSGNGKLEHYEELGYVVAVAMVVTALLMYRLHARFTRASEKQMSEAPE